VNLENLEDPGFLDFDDDEALDFDADDSDGSDLLDETSCDLETEVDSLELELEDGVALEGDASKGSEDGFTAPVKSIRAAFGLSILERDSFVRPGLFFAIIAAIYVLFDSKSTSSTVLDRAAPGGAQFEVVELSDLK
jgi:hypothetical protein